MLAISVLYLLHDTFLFTVHTRGRVERTKEEGVALKQRPEPSAGHAVITYPRANFEQFPLFFFFFLYVRAICHYVLIIVLFCQDLPTSETPQSDWGSWNPKTITGTLRKRPWSPTVEWTFLMWNSNQGKSNEHPDGGLTVTHSKADGFSKKKKNTDRKCSGGLTVHLFIYPFPFPHP